MKKIVGLVAVILGMAVMYTAAYADDDIKTANVYYGDDEEYKVIGYGAGIIFQNDVYLPLRFYTVKMSTYFNYKSKECSVGWDGETKSAFLVLDGKTTVFEPTRKDVIFNNGTVYVLLRTMGETFNSRIEYDASKFTVYVNPYREWKDPTITPELRVLNETSSFAAKLNNTMPKDKNYCFSPLSLKYALAIAACGADTQTKNEIAKALGTESIEEYTDKLKDIAAKFQFEDIERKVYVDNDNYETVNEKEGVSLNISNSVWLNKDILPNEDFTNEFKKTISDNFNASAEIVDSGNAVNKINEWCKNATNGKIPFVIDNSDFSASIINAVYFNGKFSSMFDKEYTKKDNFTDKNGKSHSIDFMNMHFEPYYYADENVQIIGLDYRRSDLILYIALSDNPSVDFEKYIDRAETHDVILSMPKFKLEFSSELKEQLKQLGIESIFDANTSHFTEMFTGDSPAFALDVLHKVYFSVDEKGTEAAAISNRILTGSYYMPDRVYEFKANRPFTYFIRDNINGEILFMGEYAYVE